MSPAQIAACEGFLVISRAKNGAGEIPGAANSPHVLECLATVAKPAWARLGLLKDETPWCSAHVNWCVTQSGMVGTNKANARSWLKWGEPLPFATVEDFDALPDGCVLIFKRGAVPWNGHVAFKARRVARFARCQGGNQHNRVCEAPYALSDLIGARVPTVAMLAPELTS